MSALAAATRPTRRDVRRHPWRILVAVLMITLPVAGLSALGTWVLSHQNAVSGPDSDAVLQVDVASCASDGTFRTENCPGQAELDAALPGGFRAEMVVEGVFGTLSSDASAFSGSLTQLPRHLLPEAAASLGADEILLPESIMQHMGVAPGEAVTVSFGPTDQEWTVAGTVPGHTSLVAEPTLLDPAGGPLLNNAGVSWLVWGPRDFNEAELTELREADFVRADSPGWESLSLGSAPSADAVAGFVGEASVFGIGLVVVMLVMAPVFSITASRQTRTFALMRAQGASGRHIIHAVLTYGAIAGIIGATAGIALGAGGAAVTFAAQYPGWPLNVSWGVLVLLWLATVAIAVVGAAFPAFRAADVPVTAGLEGVVGDRLVGWRRWMAVGPVALAVLAVVWIGARLTTPILESGFVPLVLLLALIATVASGPALMFAATAVTDRLSLAWRLAGRSARRQALVSLPSIAAVVGVVFVASHLTVTADTDARAAHEPTTQAHPPTVAAVHPTRGAGMTSSDWDAVTRLVSDVVGPARSFPLEELTPAGVVEESQAGEVHVLSQFEEMGACAEHSYQGSRSPEYLAAVTDPETAAACLPLLRQSAVSSPVRSSTSMLLATDEVLDAFRWNSPNERAAARDALSRPTVLVSSDYAAHGDSMTLTVDASENAPGGLTEVFSTDVPVDPVLPPGLTATKLVTPSLAQELELETSPGGVVVIADDAITGQEAARRALAEPDLRGLPVMFSAAVSHGINPLGHWFIAGLLGLGVVILIAFVTALSAPRQRTQLDLLAVLGAAAAVPKRVTAITAALVAFLGSALGLVAGHLSALAAARTGLIDANGVTLAASQLQHFQVNWEQALVLLVVAPLLSGLVARMIHRRSGDPQGFARRGD